MEDTGPQPAGTGPSIEMQGIDILAAVGREAEPTLEPTEEEKNVTPPGTPKREAEDELESESKRLKDGPVAEDTEAMDEDTKDPNPSPQVAETKDEDAKMDEPADEATETTKEPEAGVEA
jgi:hypothetical protein